MSRLTSASPLVLGSVMGLAVAVLYKVFNIKSEESTKCLPNTSEVGNTHDANSKNHANCITVVGSLNADLYYTMKNLPLAGETVDGIAANIGPGGKGGNQAGAAAAALSGSTASSYKSKAVTMAARIGADAHGEMFLSQLPAHGIVTSSVTISENCPTGQALILLDSAGQNSIIIAPGANEDWQACHDLSSLPAAIASLGSDAKNSVLPPSVAQSILSSQVVLLQREVPDLVNLQAAQLAKAKTVHSTQPVDGGDFSKDIVVMLDVGGRSGPIDETILPYLDYITLNETELSRVVGFEVDVCPCPKKTSNNMYDILIDQVPIIKAADILLQKGVKNVLVTLGEHGSMVISRNPQGESEVVADHCSFKVPKVVDTTGAGDCFRGYFAVAVAENLNLREALSIATAASSLCIQKLGTLPSMPTREATIAFRKEARLNLSRTWNTSNSQ